MTLRGLGILLGLAVTACTPYSAPTSDDLRSQSFQAFSTLRIGNQSLASYLRQRTAVILSGNMKVSETLTDRTTLALRFNAQPGTSLNGPCHAVCIDQRGYFLTAAHCLQGPMNYLIYSDGDTARIVIPRIVARMFDPEKQLDFAILHIDATMPCVFPWSEPVSYTHLPMKTASG